MLRDSLPLFEPQPGTPMAKLDGRVRNKDKSKGSARSGSGKPVASKTAAQRAVAAKGSTKVASASKHAVQPAKKASTRPSGAGKHTARQPVQLTNPVSSRHERKTAGRGRASTADIVPPTLPAPKAPAPTVAKASTEGRVNAQAMNKKPRAKAAPIVLPEGYRPSDAEPFMNEFHRAYFRKKLTQWKEDIIKQNKETLHVLHEDTLQHADLADRATSETDRALELRARDRQRKLIAKIDAALARIEDGSYGYCEETGEPISLKRLDARPIATLSLEAQERHERREKVYRDD